MTLSAGVCSAPSHRGTQGIGEVIPSSRHWPLLAGKEAPSAQGGVWAVEGVLYIILSVCTALGCPYGHFVSAFSLASLNPGSRNVHRLCFIESILQMGRLVPGGSVDLPTAPWDVGSGGCAGPLG